MKKVIILSFALFAGLVSFSQQRGTGNARTMSFEEANRLNGVASPTINGIPYSQYKAQQETLKAKQQAAPVIPVPKVSISNEAPVVTEKPAVTTTAAVNNAATTTAPSNFLTLPMAAPSVEKQTASSQTAPAVSKPVQTDKPKGN